MKTDFNISSLLWYVDKKSVSEDVYEHLAIHCARNRHPGFLNSLEQRR